jgi:hypothetical protein
MAASASVPRRRARGLLVPLVLAAAAIVPALVPRAARAEGASIARELDALGEWVAAKKHETCTTHCYVISRLRVTGSVEAGLSFTLEGSVLADGPVAIPLFGTPEHVRIEDAKIDGKPAAVGFEGDHYYLHTAAKQFVLEGKLHLDATRALVVAGAVNAFEAELAKGSIQEGAKLSGLSGTTLHFDGLAPGAPGSAEIAQAPVFQLARAVRIGREVTFQYALSLRSTGELGVVRLPLANGERVLDVTGATGWKVEGDDLVLTLAGRAASLSIQGSLGAPAASAANSGKPWSFAPDARSTFEWWLVESDPEHKLQIEGSARPAELSEAPLAATQPNARAFVVTRGQTLSVDVRQLAQTESLSAVVRTHRRTLVVSARGDLVADDELQYENNGVDDLRFSPAGRSIFLALDGTATKVLAAPDGPGVVVPLYKGVHSARVQSIGAASLARFGGVLAMPTPSQPLTASRVELSLGLPREIHPVALLGGDRPVWFFGAKDALAVAFGAGASILALAGWRRRTLGALALGGLWFASPEAFVGLFALGAIAVLAERAARAFVGRAGGKGTMRAALAAMALLGVTTLFFGLATSRSDRAAPASARAVAQDSRDGKNELDRGENERALEAKMAAAPTAMASASAAPATASGKTDGVDELKVARGGLAGDVLSQAGLRQGVAPVALPTPGADRYVSTVRELVTADRPFDPRLIYFTDTALWPAIGVWIAAIAALAWASRQQARDAVVALRARWATPEAQGAGAATLVPIGATESAAPSASSATT